MPVPYSFLAVPLPPPPFSRRGRRWLSAIILSSCTGLSRASMSSSLAAKLVDGRAKRDHECVREDALSAEWKSPSYAVMAYAAEGNCVAQSEVESNRKRTDSPQENKPDSAASRGEPAHGWRSLEPIER